MDQPAHALDMITKFTRDEPFVQQDGPAVQVEQASAELASLLGRRAGIASVA